MERLLILSVFYLYFKIMNVQDPSLPNTVQVSWDCTSSSVRLSLSPFVPDYGNNPDPVISLS